MVENWKEMTIFFDVICMLVLQDVRNVWKTFGGRIKWEVYEAFLKMK